MPKTYRNSTNSFSKNESGASSIEYALIVSLIFLVIVTAWRGVGTSQEQQFNEISNAVEGATS